MKKTICFLLSAALFAASCAVLASCAELQEETFVEYHERLVPGQRR